MQPQYLNPSDANPWYGLSDNDRTFRFATSGIYQLPWGRGRRFFNHGGIGGAVAGGWQVQGVYQVQSGQPLSFDSGALATNGTSLPVYLGNNPADSAGAAPATGRASAGAGNAGNWFNTANWAQRRVPIETLPANSPVSTATSTRSALCPFVSTGCAQTSSTSSTVRSSATSASRASTSRWCLQFRLDLINVLNHPVYGGGGNNKTPVTDWTSTTFGEVTAQENQPRIYQFEAFLRF